MIALSLFQMNKSILWVSNYPHYKIICSNWLAIGKLQFRNLIVLTMSIKAKWFTLGCVLCVPIDKLERLDDKYHDNPMKALVRVYRYWLADKNGLQPTWEKLLRALQKINEYRLATSLARTQLVSFIIVPNMEMLTCKAIHCE